MSDNHQLCCLFVNVIRVIHQLSTSYMYGHKLISTKYCNRQSVIVICTVKHVIVTANKQQSYHGVHMFYATLTGQEPNKHNTANKAP